MATISLNLGLLNLLPIPVLDGGHIFIMALEGLARRDFSMRVKEKMLLAGFVAADDADGDGHLQRPHAHQLDRASDALALAQFQSPTFNSQRRSNFQLSTLSSRVDDFPPPGALQIWALKVDP